MQRALAKDPRQRFSSVYAFANAFDQASRRTGFLSVIKTIPTFEPTLPPVPGKRLDVFAAPIPQDSDSPTVSSPPVSSRRKPMLSRRTVLAGAAGLAVIVAAGGISLLAHTSFHNRGNAPELTSTRSSIVTGSWSQLPALLSPEADNAAIYLHFQRRDYIYINGGYRGNNNSLTHDDGLYRYDIGAGQWTAVTMTFPGMFDNAVALDEKN